MKSIPLLFMLFLFSFKLWSQEIGTLLFVSDKGCKLSIDGDAKSQLVANQPFKVDVSVGEHYIQCVTDEGKEDSQVATVENQKQKVIKFGFNTKPEVSSKPPAESKLEPITVANLNFEIPGQVLATVAAMGESQIPNEPIFHYVFEEGDEILMDCMLENEKGSIDLEVTSYPENIPVYSKKNFKRLTGEKYKIFKKGIYKFHFSTSHGWDRKGRFILKRLPENESKINFNTTAIKRKKYKAVTVQEPSRHYINSTSNEEYLGGKAKILIPVTLPPNTVEWYYIASATRNQEEIKNTMGQFQLFGDLTKAIAGITPTTTVLNIGLNLITQPPGANYCSVYLLDNANYNQFKSGKPFQHFVQGTRENFTSSVSKVNCCNSGLLYLGFYNPDFTHGIHVGVEVVAVVAEEGFMLE